MSLAGKRLLAVLFGCAIFLGGAEIVTRVVFSQAIQFDVEMWRYARELKATGLTSGLRFEHQPDRYARLMGVAVDINADGLRERPIARPKRPGVFRIALVGDSIAFGWGVPQEQTLSRQLETLLNQERPLGREIDFEVLNFGVGNYNIQDVAAMLEKKALAYAPDLVIYGAFVNDAEMPAATTEPLLLRHSLFAVWLWGRLDALWRQVGWRQSYRDYYLGLYREGGEGRQLVQRAMDSMAASCARAGTPLIVAMLPELHDDGGAIFQPVRGVYRQAAAQAGAGFIDLDATLPKQGRRRFWVSHDDAHPNATACGLYAQTIASAVSWPPLLQPH